MTPSTPPSPCELSPSRTRSTFVVPPDEGQLFLSLTELLARTSAPFHEIGNALRANIAGVISTVTVPYTLANRSATESAWQRISTTERIRALEVHYPGTKTEAELKAGEVRQEQVARESAKSKMESFLRSPEGTEALIWHTLGFLESFLSDNAALRAANDLVLQGAVLCWGAFEVLARDCFVAHLNEKPIRSLVLLGDATAKRRFESSKISLETLATHNFDLSGRMGTLLAHQQDLSDVYSVKSVYQALFPDNKSLSDALSDPP
jgi:hypothetical protein